MVDHIITMAEQLNSFVLEKKFHEIRKGRIYSLIEYIAEELETIATKDISSDKRIQFIEVRDYFRKLSKVHNHQISGDIGTFSLKLVDSIKSLVPQQSNDMDSQSVVDLTILCLSSDPVNQKRLRLAEEVRAIRERVQLSLKRDDIKLEIRESARTVDFTQAIHDVSPNIVHFSGHGSRKGEICFEDETGLTKAVPATGLESLFSLIEDSVICVLLNICHSASTAKIISKHIPFVIGMNGEISDEAAISFSVGFYMALASQKTIPASFGFAKAQISMEYPGEEDIPKLYSQELENINIKASAPSLHQVPKPTRSADQDKLKYERDAKSLSIILQTINFTALTEFISNLPYKISNEIFFYWEGFHHMFIDSTFHLYDEPLMAVLQEFHDTWEKCLSHGNQYHPASNPQLLIFNTAGDIFDEEQDKAWDAILEDKDKLETSMNELLELIRTRYVELDISELSKISLNEYVEFYQELQERFK